MTNSQGNVLNSGVAIAREWAIHIDHSIDQMRYGVNHHGIGHHSTYEEVQRDLAKLEVLRGEMAAMALKYTFGME